MTNGKPALLVFLLVLMTVSLRPRVSFAQSPGAVETPQQETKEAKNPREQDKTDENKDAEPSSQTIFGHSQSSRFWISGQINIIFQAHPSFKASYSGPNSFRSHREHATSDLLTLYTGVQLTRNTELLFDIESAGGRGLSDALGLAGFTNLDVVRNPTLGSKPYVSRLMIRHIIPLSRETTKATRGPLSLATELPVRRLEIRAGKFSMADFFDVNSVGSDSHLQFMNWTVDNNGAYDYAADTRGYTYGVIAEYQDRNWGVRFAESLMPKVANGLNLDLNLGRASAENLEFEVRGNLLPAHPGVFRLLAYLNRANMGNYRRAVEDFRAGRTSVPDITAHPLQTRKKYGFGVNFEQELSKTVRVFGRYGWNDGHNESYAYTEVDNTADFGFDVKGNRWHRKEDKVGVAFVTNGISGDHQSYLALGGLGFLLGDGALTYGRENIVEAYYTAHLWRGIFGSFNLQHINHPGYNRDRGPVLVPGLRLHIDF